MARFLVGAGLLGVKGLLGLFVIVGVLLEGLFEIGGVLLVAKGLLGLFVLGGVLLLVAMAVAVARATVSAGLDEGEGEEPVRAGAEKGGGGLRGELGEVAVFLSADKVASATHAIELVEELEGLELKDEEVRKRSLEEVEALRREVEGLFKEARRRGEEERMAVLWSRAESARSCLSSSRRLEGGPRKKGSEEDKALS